jgi:hypothetical protein
MRISAAMTGRNRGVRGTILLATVVLAISSAMPIAGAAAERRTFVINNCRDRITIRPRSILFACGDGAFYVREMEAGTGSGPSGTAPSIRATAIRRVPRERSTRSGGASC